MDLYQFQVRVRQWVSFVFHRNPEGQSIRTRTFRFLEEALELAQATGCTEEEAHKLVKYTFGRPIGTATQEIGGVMVTLAALCDATGLDLRSSAITELVRVEHPDMMERIRKKQASKLQDSPLPGDG